MSTQLHPYELNGVKESVEDFISNLSPQDTPFASMTKKKSEHNTVFHWLVDEDGAPAIQTGHQSGSDAVYTDMVEPKTLTSFTQIFKAAAIVDKTTEAMGLYGRGKAMMYQMAKTGRVMKKSMEMTMLSNQTGQACASGKAGRLDGVGTRRVGAAGINAAVCNNFVNAAAKKLAGFKESELRKLTRDIFAKGGRPSVIMFPLEYTEAFSALREQTATQNMFDGETKATYNRQVDTYVDPLGQRFKLVPNQYMPADTIYILDPSMFTQHILRNFSKRPIATDKDAVAEELVIEFGLANRNPDAMGIYNLTNTALATVS